MILLYPVSESKYVPNDFHSDVIVTHWPTPKSIPVESTEENQPGFMVSISVSKSCQYYPEICNCFQSTELLMEFFQLVLSQCLFCNCICYSEKNVIL